MLGQEIEFSLSQPTLNYNNKAFKDIILPTMHKHQNTDTLNSNLLESEEKYKSLSLLIKLALNCGLSAFYYGYCLTYFNSINYQHIVSIFNLEDYPRALTQGCLTGSTFFTGAIGTILSTQLINRFSRRQSLMILNVFIILVTFFNLIPSFATLVISRLSQGLIIGNISCITPLYIREMMPKEVSGPLWSLHQVLFVIGVSFGFILTYLLSFFADPVSSWRIIFGFPLVTSTIQLISFHFFFRFDTPKWYILHDEEQKAKQTLGQLYKPAYVELTLKQVIAANSYKRKSSQRKTKLSDIFQAQIQLDILEANGSKKQQQLNTQTKKAQKHTTNNPLAIFASFYLIGQQAFLGGVPIIQFANEMTIKTFPNLQKSFPVVINLVAIAGSILSIYILKNWGRKQILVNGVLISAVSLTIGFLIFWHYDFTKVTNNSFILRVTLLIIFLTIRLCLSSAMGPVPWLYIAEIIQPNLVPWCSLFNWGLHGFVTTLFPIMCEINNGNPSLAFFIFSVVSGFSYFVNKKVLVETKNKTQLQIRKQYDQLYH